MTSLRSHSIESEEEAAQRPDQAGVTFLEVLIMILIISIMTSIAVGAAMTTMQKAQLGRCFADLRAIQALIYADALEGGLPDPDTFWADHWRDVKPGPYHYEIDGNGPHDDLDAFDESGAGNAPRTAKDIKFVVFCQHDHGDLARYVYVVDDGPPTVTNSTNDPHFDRHLPGAHGF